MKLTRYAFLPIRLGFCLVTLVSSLFSLMAYIPFTYEQVHKGGAIEGLLWFARIQPYLYALIILLLAFSLRPEWSSPKTRWLVTVFFLLTGGMALLGLCTQIWKHLRNDLSSLILSLLLLIPLLLLFLIDWLSCGKNMNWERSQEAHATHFFWAASGSALFVGSLYSVLCSRQLLTAQTDNLLNSGWHLVLGWSIFSHLILFLGIFLIMSLVCSCAGLFASGTKFEFAITNSLLATGVYCLTRQIAFPPLGFYGWPALLYALTLSLALIGWLAGTSLRLESHSGETVHDGIGLSFRLFGLTTNGSVFPNLILLGIFSSAFVFLALRLAAFDWNFLAQKLLVVALWVFCLGSFYAMTKFSRPFKSSLLLVVVIFLLLTYKTLEASAAQWWGFPENGPNATQAVLDRYAKYDISFQLARQIISPPQLNDSLFEFLTHHTNIPRSVHINPTDINFVENLQGNLGPRPHVFIFVIDSLRRDYLSPYNPAVRFTPSIQSLASDSLVFENAFTRYGGTGLSEPSLWVGGMLVHQQYVTPFAPMNTLQKLLRAEQYRCFVSRDSILDTILSPWPALFDLDKGSATLHLDFCNTLHELKKNLADPQNQKAPIFAYTQPQNIHISVINREGKNVLDNDSYPGFYAPYASRIKRIDACLGEFVSFLKSSGLYEESIIILTADHGESLGEDGRWGHAYTIFPEVLRIPLILHLPAHLRPQSPADTKAVAFLTDVTPTLYALLGHRPSRSSEMLGRPLFTIGPVGSDAPRPSRYLVASSYGAVYGVLTGQGNQLYIADAVNYRDYLYDLSQSSLGVSVPVSDSVRQDNENFIREHVSSIGKFYGYNPE